jgi:hypothetical protein
VSSVDVPPDVPVSDGGKHLSLSSLHLGAYLEIRGYAEPAGRVRASSIRVLHPALDITGILSQVIPALIVQTATGDVYRLSLTAQTRIAVERSAVEVAAADLPVGGHVHVTGTMASNGALRAEQLTVRLASVTLEGSVQSVQPSSFAVQTPGGVESVQVQSVTSVLQGSKSIDLASLVPGDDVTVLGYRSGRGSVIARKVSVHRKLVGLDGFVSGMGEGTFSLTLSSGSVVQVQLGPATEITGGAVAAGMDVHVTGYRRGDGVVLATRVRVGKRHA